MGLEKRSKRAEGKLSRSEWTEDMDQGCDYVDGNYGMDWRDRILVADGMWRDREEGDPGWKGRSFILGAQLVWTEWEFGVDMLYLGHRRDTQVEWLACGWCSDESGQGLGWIWKLEGH